VYIGLKAQRFSKTQCKGKHGYLHGSALMNGLCARGHRVISVMDKNVMLHSDSADIALLNYPCCAATQQWWLLLAMLETASRHLEAASSSKC
jgi:hypothetical protein